MLEVEQVVTKIVFVVEPTDAVSGELISPAVVAEIRDANDHLAPYVVTPVTLTIEANPRGGTLSGITTVNAIGGVATFDGLSIDKPAADHTLTAASGTLASVTSTSFSIAQRICTLIPAARPIPTGQGGPYTVDESRIPDFTGTFLMDGDFSSIGRLSGFAVADFNNDDLDDFLYVGTITPDLDVGVPVRILANDGTGSFVDATSTIFIGEVPAPVSGGQGLAEDFNGDGWTDLFIHQVGLDTGGGVGGLNILLLSDGFGGLVDSPANIHDVAGFSHSSASGDVDCDGDIDIYVGNMGHPGTHEPNYLMINDGSGVFTVRKEFLPEFVRLGAPSGGPSVPDWSSSSITDLDGDNFPELILGRATPPSDEQGNRVGDAISESVVLWNDGTGNFDFADFTLLPDRLGNLQTKDVLPIDIDLDGDLDLVMAVTTGNPGTRDIQILVNNGDRTFSDETPSRISGVTTNAQSLLNVLAIDFNGDGAPDLLLQHDDPGFSGYHELIFLNNGVGVFTPLDNSFLADKTGVLFPLDADGDGGLDFIVWNPGGGLLDHDYSLLVHN